MVPVARRTSRARLTTVKAYWRRRSYWPAQSRGVRSRSRTRDRSPADGPRAGGMSPGMHRAKGGGTRRLPGAPGEGLANAEDAADSARRGQDRYAEEPPPEGTRLVMVTPLGSEASAAATSLPWGDIRHSDTAGSYRPRPSPAPDHGRTGGRLASPVLVAVGRGGPTRPAGQWPTSPSSCRRARRRSTGRCAGSRRRGFRAAPSRGPGRSGPSRR